MRYVGWTVLIPISLFASACGPALIRGQSSSNSSQTSTGEHRIFVTSKIYSGGDFVGVAGADAECQTLATAAGLSGTYKAVLSDSATDANKHVTISYAVYHYSSPTTKALIAADSADFWNAAGKNFTDPVTYTEDFQDFSGTLVWTGSTSAGVDVAPGSTNKNCDDWTASGNSGNYGIVAKLNGNWFDSGAGLEPCTTKMALYCISQ